MSELFIFPPVSKESKLSASPTIKIPQSTDWIFQDFFDTMIHGDPVNELSPSIQISELFPRESMLESPYEKHSFLLANLHEAYTEFSLPSEDDQQYDNDMSLEDLSSPPVLIESNISSVNDSSIASIPDAIITEVSFHTLTKRKSNASFSSLKSSIMNVLHLNKKTKVQHDSSFGKKHSTTSLNSSSISLKLKKYFKF